MIEENVQLPSTTFKVRERDESIGGDNPFKWVQKTTKDYFGGKRVVAFALPGAFTPTCSTYQVPGFIEMREEFRKLGIDEIIVISVNDTFVMRKWMIDQDALGKIEYIPDGNGEFTRDMGMLVEKTNLGFAYRSWRYAMVVDDMKIEKMFVEPGFGNNVEDDPYGVSSPETVLEYLRSK